MVEGQKEESTRTPDLTLSNLFTTLLSLVTLSTSLPLGAFPVAEKEGSVYVVAGLRIERGAVGGREGRLGVVEGLGRLVVKAWRREEERLLIGREGRGEGAMEEKEVREDPRWEEVLRRLGAVEERKEKVEQREEVEELRRRVERLEADLRATSEVDRSPVTVVRKREGSGMNALLLGVIAGLVWPYVKSFF